MTATGPVKVFAREAAVVALGELLKTKNRGDRITAAEVQAATGSSDWRSFGGRVRTWAKKTGIVLFAVPNDGWRIGMPAEHVDFADKKRVSALRSEKRGLKALLDVPRAQLDDTQERRAEFAVRLAARRCAQLESDDKETKREFKLTERVPLRVLSGK